jgi:uncharacterized OsmC-like protein
VAVFSDIRRGAIMIVFTEDFRNRMQKKLALLEEADRKKAKSNVKVTVVKLDNQLSEAVSRNGLKWTADEDGPSPLDYFVSSLAMCQMVHYSEHAASDGIDIRSLKIEVTGTFSLAHPRSFEEIGYIVYLESGEGEQKLAGLARIAEHDCYVTNTLKKACRVTGRVIINGKTKLML